ncbi:MAG: Glycogen debranching enzyme [Thermoanaerobaculia bacterium]|nr:Glycogen debranching enzyme [Thermoanaerobaculia bacterium]
MSGSTSERTSRLAVTKLFARRFLLGTAIAALSLLSVKVEAAAPSSVTIAGSFQKALGCPDDWQPSCPATQLAFDEEGGVWKKEFTIPAGQYEYKAAMNGAWDESYGGAGGANVKLNLTAETKVKFYFDYATKWVTDSKTSIIATVPGSYQEFIGCSGNWNPACMKSWLQDPDGDGVYTFSTRSLPAGSYEAKAAINEGWNENYGQDGVANGPNIAFTVPASCTEMLFSFNGTTKVLTIKPGAAAAQPQSVTIAGSLQTAVGCASNWDPPCDKSMLKYDAEDGVWQASFTVPAGSYEYKAALNGSWDENYGANAQRGGANIPLTLAASGGVKFYFDYGTKWITSNKNATIATVPGDFQKYLGCADNWQPGCLRSWLQDPDGDGTYTFSTKALPAGDYQGKVAVNESWDENYGADGAPGGNNISFTVPSNCADVFFSWDSTTKKLTISASGAPKGNLKRARAYWVTKDTILWKLEDQTANAFFLNAAPLGGLTIGAGGIEGGTEIPLTLDPAGPSAEIKAKFPHLASLQAFKLPSEKVSMAAELLKGQVAFEAGKSVAAPTPGGPATFELIDATSLQIQGVLDDLFTYTGALGITWNGSVPTLRVWAPTAKSVHVHIFDSSTSSPAAKVLPMEAGASGTWSITGEANWNRKFYLYEVEVYVPSTGKVEHNIVTDPYSLSLSINSGRSQIVNLDDADLKPADWDSTAKPALDAPEDIVLYELHVRDFSVNDASVPQNMRGTFKAFTQTASNGMKHLDRLAKAGLTHVHLLPAFDIATIDENKANWKAPEGDLASYASDSDKQQAAVTAVADQDGFNWGYDPWHYTVPEGSYSTDPDGTARIKEFREMVQSLNKTGLRAVMDVVYNHTNAAGQNAKSVLDRIVPGYYHRLNADGNVETSTCCQNTATEFAMMEKLMIDSVLTWTKAYKVDGFRFDLMGHHMKSNMLKLRGELNKLATATDGVDGTKVYVYGEGWNFGEVADNARGVNATQLNMAGTGIGTFTDRLRDAVRGGGPFSGIQEQGFASGILVEPNGTNQGTAAELKAKALLYMDQIRVGLAGNLQNIVFQDRTDKFSAGAQIPYGTSPAGYALDPQETITYVEAHDNETFYDALASKLAVATPMNQRYRHQLLGMGTVLLSQGVPFIHAGQEILRSKSMDRNSYNSGDWFNKLDFTYQSNNFGVGLPPEGDNKSNWPVMQPRLANAALKPASADIQSTFNGVLEFLQIRKSSRLFRLRGNADIAGPAPGSPGVIRFFNTGSTQTPGLIAMQLSDPRWRYDRQRSEIFVFFNALPASANFPYTPAAGYPYYLHPAQAKSTDAVTKSAKYDIKTGTFTIPAKTVSVFMLPRSIYNQIYFIVDDVNKLVSAGTLTSAAATPLLNDLWKAAGDAAASGEAAGLTTLGTAFIPHVMGTASLDSANKAKLVGEATAIITFFQGLAP